MAGLAARLLTYRQFTSPPLALPACPRQGIVDSGKGLVAAEYRN